MFTIASETVFTIVWNHCSRWIGIGVHDRAEYASLRYFENILDEIRERNIPAEYCDYLSFRIQRIEKLWIESHKTQDQPVEITAPQPGTETGADSLIDNVKNPKVP